MKCPESIEELQEIEKMLPLCKVTLFEQAKARIETGVASSVSEASRQLAEELEKDPETIRTAIRREDRGGTLSHLSETDKFRPESCPHVSYNSGENEWYTPLEYIEATLSVLGKIDIDPASSDIANETVGAKVYYKKENSGLEQKWEGSVFMNPPYASELIKQFASKFASHVVNGDIKEGIVLVNNATETLWFKELVACATAIVFTTGRIKFVDMEGNRSGSPLQGQCFLYFGNKKDEFINEFKQFGWGAILV